MNNDFFHNKYNIATKLKYFCIQEREVTEWKKYFEKNKTTQSNIIFLKDFKDE